jgi:hypothetical protein
MARKVLHSWLKLERIRCHDEGDGWGSAEPYLWTVFFKIDGDSVALTESLMLSGHATVVGTPAVTETSATPMSTRATTSRSPRRSASGAPS